MRERTLKSGVQIDTCDTCHGTWLDGGELLHLTANYESVKQGILLLVWENRESDRSCPRCDCRMSVGAFLDDETQVEYCDECEGMWFDARELKEALRYLDADPLPTLSQEQALSKPKMTMDAVAPILQRSRLARKRTPPPGGGGVQERAALLCPSPLLALRRLLTAFSKRYWAFRDVLLFAAIGFSCLMLISLYQTTWRMSQLDWILVEAVAGRGYIKTYESSSGDQHHTSHTLHMTYSYEVHGKRYSGSYTSGGVREAPSQGSMMGVYYNPDDPSDTTRMRRRGIVESWAIVIVTGW
ncbi:MAG: zf-TFIIB domain-containing protein, partial [bacterium]